MNAIILSVGDELVLGQTVDTNSAWLSAQLAAVGCDVVRHVTVGDDQRDIERAIQESAGDCEFLLVTGGIGPTDDDLTRQALAAVMKVPLDLNEKWLESLLEFFKARGRTMPPTNRIQAMIPRGAQIIENTCGTAAGIRAEWGSGFSVQGSVQSPLNPEPRTPSMHIFIMPGVPKEMKAMFVRDVLPFVKQQTGGAVILQRTLHTFGLGESHVAEMLGDLMKRGRNPSVGTTVANGIVSLRINARFESPARAQKEIEPILAACREKLGSLIFGTDGQPLQDVVAQLLFEQKATVSTAESCTGGLLAKCLTDISGSSDYFKRGWIVYSNEAKRELLNVPAEILDRHGAVSEPVVKAMAENARRLASADFALSISGIAGPTGGTVEKPVGTVCIALASANDTLSRTFNFPGDRETIRDRSAKMALTILRFSLLKQPLPF